ncbi:helix-turn-helix domain-containing protein [Accumulibacter sp.]|uniref:helix-turn-helix domain-containing protein n=1 Tax=Accumulibacter sp. TaxID=2053492 RepID=UPI002623B4DF|nr:helix-turn-helix domain-containing protein [Accumulibacter sp.]
MSAAEPEFTVAVLDWALASSVAVTLDALRSANRLAEALGRRRLAWRVLGSRASVPLSNGLLLPAEPLLAETELGRTTLIIPGLGLDHPSLDAAGEASAASDAARRFDGNLVGRRIELPDAQLLAAKAQALAASGELVSASCSGVLVLAAAGLLAGRRATTHWRLNAYLQRRYPACKVDTTQMVLRDGNILTAGAALAQMDLMLVLIGEHYGLEVADLVMRYLLLDGRPSQSRYMAWSHLQSTDDTVRRLEMLIEKSLPEVPSLSALADSLHVSEKTLARRVRRATGQTPLAVIQSVRLRHAQHLLEATRLPISEVASRVGYADATALRKLTLKNLRLAPGQLRGRR